MVHIIQSFRGLHSSQKFGGFWFRVIETRYWFTFKKLQASPSKALNPGGHMSKFWQGCSSYFLGLKFCQILFFWVGKFFSYFSGFRKFFSYFSGFRKFSPIFLGLTNFQLFFWVFQFLYQTLESFEWRTHSTEKQNHSSFSYLFKLWQPLHLDLFYFFLGLNLESF